MGEGSAHYGYAPQRKLERDKESVANAVPVPRGFLQPGRAIGGHGI